jgi:hypothetical protein
VRTDRNLHPKWPFICVSCGDITRLTNVETRGRRITCVLCGGNVIPTDHYDGQFSSCVQQEYRRWLEEEGSTPTGPHGLPQAILDRRFW